MTIARILSLLLALSLLSACKLTSQYDLHRKTSTFSPPAFFDGRNAVFSSREGSYVIMDFKDGLATLTLTELNVDKTDNVRTSSLIVQFDGTPDNLFFFVYPESGKYSYFPFFYTQTGFTWIKPKNSIKVTTVAGLVREAQKSSNPQIRFRQLGASEARDIRAEFRAVKAAKERKRKAKKKKKNN